MRAKRILLQIAAAGAFQAPNTFDNDTILKYGATWQPLITRTNQLVISVLISSFDQFPTSPVKSAP